MADQSQHVVQIPQAVNIAASQDSSISNELRQEAIGYLAKVKELSEETWKACLTLYLQGAGASPGNPIGRDGKEKLSHELRVYCLQVVDDVLGNKPEVVAEQDLVALHQALMSYVQTEFVEGSAELGLSFIRNKFCYTLTLCFLRLYPSPVPDFLTPFLSFLDFPQSSADGQNLQPTIITLRMLCEIAAEVHDPLLKSARKWTAERNSRDGQIRDSLRTRGEVKIILDGLVNLVEQGIRSNGGSAMQEVIDWSLNTLATWAPWVDINASVTQDSLELYRKLVEHPTARYRSVALNVYAILLHKGARTSADKLQIVQVLDVMSFVIPLEKNTRLSGRKAEDVDEDEVSFRASLGKVLAAYGTETLKMSEDETADPSLRAQTEKMCYETLPMLLKFVEDNNNDVYDAVSPLLSDIMRIYKKARKANETGYVLPQDRAQFFATLLETLVSQMQWAEDSEWDPADPGEEEDEDYEAFSQRRMRMRSEIDQIAQIDAELTKSRIIAFITETYGQIQMNGPQSVPWQRAELAVHLTYIFGELQRTSTQGKEIFFNIPAEVTNALRERSKERADRYRESETTGQDVLEAQMPAPAREMLDFNQLTLTPQGQMLEQAISAGILRYPHAAVTLQYLECVSRYSEFYKCRPQHIQPVLEAFVDQRGIHNEKKAVRQRVIYLFSKFVKDARRYIDKAFVPAILNGISDALPIVAVLPVLENPADDVLAKATTGTQGYDTYIYLYESVGTLISLVRDSNEQTTMLQAAFGPLVQELAVAVQKLKSGVRPELVEVLQVHHVIIAIGALARGFPEPGEVPPTKVPSWIAAFEQPSQAVLQALEAFKSWRIVRDASRTAMAGIIATLAHRGTHLVAPLVVHTVDQFEPQELLEFFGFLGMLAHRLRGDIKDILDELVPILSDRVYALLATPATGTDEAILQGNMKKGYLSFLQTIFTDELQDIFLSARNKSHLDTFINHLLAIATEKPDRSDRSSQKTAIFLLMRTIQSWAALPSVPTAFLTEAALFNKESKKLVKVNGNATNGNGAPGAVQVLPGYETVAYERMLPAMFQTILDPDFKSKDGQASLVVHEIANLLREVIAARGQEAVEFLENRFLPSTGCPPVATEQLLTRVRSDTVKDFKKFFSDFVKEWKAGMET